MVRIAVTPPTRSGCPLTETVDLSLVTCNWGHGGIARGVGYFEPDWVPPLYRENPRCISNLFQMPEDTPTHPRLNTLLVSYGQYIMHDVRGWSVAGASTHAAQKAHGH